MSRRFKVISCKGGGGAHHNWQHKTSGAVRSHFSTSETAVDGWRGRQPKAAKLHLAPHLFGGDHWLCFHSVTHQTLSAVHPNCFQFPQTKDYGPFEIKSRAIPQWIQAVAIFSQMSLHSVDKKKNLILLPALIAGIIYDCHCYREIDHGTDGQQTIKRRDLFLPVKATLQDAAAACSITEIHHWP